MSSIENSLPEYAVFTQVDRLISWAREHSMAALTVDLACCGVEMTQVAGPRFDIERFGVTPVVSPSHADLMIIAGTITYKSAEILKKYYEQMASPKYVMAIGSCAISGAPFAWDVSYSCVSGADKLFPVDIYVPGCPPRPEAVLQGLIKLKEKIKITPVLVKNEMRNTNRKSL